MTIRTKMNLISIGLLVGAYWYACRDTTAGRSLPLGTVADSPDSLRALLINQPDFTAEENLRFSEEKLIKELKGFSTSYSVSKKGSTYRRDRGVVISYERPDQPAVLVYPRSREYVESPRLGIWFEDAASPGLLATQDPTSLVFERAGDSEVNGHRCLKVQLSNKNDTSTRVIYYVASNLRNLVIQTELIDLFRTKICTLKNISFDVSRELFVLPMGYKKSAADPTAEYRLLDIFQLGDLGNLSAGSLRSALLEKIPFGTSGEQIYDYLEERLVGNDPFSSYYRAEDDKRIVCRMDYDPTLPGLVKKHFSVTFFLDEDKKLREVRLDSWLTGP
jgi:hypothetical protein